MPVRLTFTFPPDALKKLMENYRRGDPELMATLKELGVEAIQPHEEHALAAWEDDGGK